MSAQPMRADARGNRTRILEVAEDVFGRGGSAASTEEVARIAGVGIATVFRHFPTKRELLEAVLVRHFAGLLERAKSLAGAADPGRAFLDIFGHVVDNASDKLAIVEAFTDPGGEAEQAARDLR